MINKESRILYLQDCVNSSTMGSMCFDLLTILSEDDKNKNEQVGFVREPIKLYINSLGGDVYDMWSLVELMKSSKTPIHTYCTGYAMSCGFLIFLAGNKRYIGSNSTLLYHQIAAWKAGKYEDFKQNITHLDRMQNQIEQYVMVRTSISQKKLDEIRVKKIDWHIYPEEAIKLGIADEIMS